MFINPLSRSFASKADSIADSDLPVTLPMDLTAASKAVSAVFLFSA